MDYKELNKFIPSILLEQRKLIDLYVMVHKKEITLVFACVSYLFLERKRNNVP